jgi:hypothetical protein|tara:strand:+ start:93 stop:377 length:285 start_codon:yes stop_codon:yes gene_type:complete
LVVELQPSAQKLGINEAWEQATKVQQAAWQDAVTQQQQAWKRALFILKRQKNNLRAMASPWGGSKPSGGSPYFACCCIREVDEGGCTNLSWHSC